MISSVHRVFVCAAVALAIAARASAQDAAPSPVAYTIDVRLDPANHTLVGRERVRWRNRTAGAATELQFHLYFNAWRDAASTWMREHARAADRATPLLPSPDGSIDVTSVRLLGASGSTDLLPAQRFIAPDDGNADDRTVVVLPLPTAVAPDERVDVEIAWRARIPRAVNGIGYRSDFNLLGRWYPQIGVLQETGWNCHQAHVTGRTFSDFASYDVRMTVPAGWTVGATGARQVSGSGGDGTATYRFVHDRVTDFAWTASPAFQVRHDRVDSPDVELELLLQPEHSSQAERHFAAARTALHRFAEWFGGYPYRRLTIVDPAWQSGADAMAFPMLVTAGTHWRQPAAEIGPEAAIAHGVAMQFWSAAIAPNGAEDEWLEEGLSRYSAARLMPELSEQVSRAPGSGFYKRFFGGFIPYRVRAVTQSVHDDANIVGGYRMAAKADTPARPSYAYAPATAGRISGDKTVVWLETLERYLGWPALQRILEAYAERFWFSHPAPADFFKIASDVSGRDLSWYFDEVYRSADVFDYGIERVDTRRESAPDETPLFRTTVVARRYGDAIFPGTGKPPIGELEQGDAIETTITFADGRKTEERWDGRARWKAFTFESAVPAVSAEVDPRHVLLLDTNRTNNSWTLAPRADVASLKWSARWMIWLQDLLLSYAALV